MKKYSTLSLPEVNIRKSLENNLPASDVTFGRTFVTLPVCELNEGVNGVKGYPPSRPLITNARSIQR